jgi:hypothetical protein
MRVLVLLLRVGKQCVCVPRMGASVVCGVRTLTQVGYAAIIRARGRDTDTDCAICCVLRRCLHMRPSIDRDGYASVSAILSAKKALCFAVRSARTLRSPFSSRVRGTARGPGPGLGRSLRPAWDGTSLRRGPGAQPVEQETSYSPPQRSQQYQYRSHMHAYFEVRSYVP